MGLLVEYKVKDGKQAEHLEAMKAFIAGLRDLGDQGFTYTGYTADEGARFLAVFDFDDDAAKQRFLDSAPFAEYRDSSTPRFNGPPNTTAIARIASTAD